MFIHASDNAPTAEMIMTVREIRRAVMKNNQCNEPVGTSESKGTKDDVLKNKRKKRDWEDLWSKGFFLQVLPLQTQKYKAYVYPLKNWTTRQRGKREGEAAFQDNI